MSLKHIVKTKYKTKQVTQFRPSPCKAGNGENTWRYRLTLGGPKNWPKIRRAHTAKTICSQAQNSLSLSNTRAR